jgi:non-specific serine/threonine protein kinase
LQINLTLSSWRGIVACLTGIAATLVAKGDGRAAARLLGATETLLLNATTALSLTDRVQWDHTQQLIPSLLDEETLQAARAEGRTLTLQHIVDIALAPEHPATKGQNSSQLSSIPCHVSNLSPRERQVAVLLAQGNTNREIAEQLVVGVKSVETYVTRILNKLGLSSRLQIALWAVEHGLQVPTETLQ